MVMVKGASASIEITNAETGREMKTDGELRGGNGRKDQRAAWFCNEYR